VDELRYGPVSYEAFAWGLSLHILLWPAGRVTRPTWLNASQKDRTRDSFHGTFLAVVHHLCHQKSQIPAVKQLGENW